MHLKFWSSKSSKEKTQHQLQLDSETSDSFYIPDSPVPKPPMSEYVPRENESESKMMVGGGTNGSSMNTNTVTNAPLTVVELFQSQGCSSCPPANDNVISISDDPDVLVLTYEVTYWDRLGWKDTFGNTLFDTRQRDYARAFGNRGAYTPQVVVNGREEGVGNRHRELYGMLERGRAWVAEGGGLEKEREKEGEMVRILVEKGAGSRYTISLSSSSPSPNQNQTHDVLLLHYDPRTLTVCIPRGENAGRTLPHKNIVTSLVRLGAWSPSQSESESDPKSTFSFDVEQSASKGQDGELKTAVLVQRGRGGPIVGAARISG